MNNKILTILVVIALLLGILGIIFPKVIPAIVGGSVHNIQESFDEGIAVDGVELISGTGQIITSKLYNFGIVASSAITAAQICDYDYLQINPAYDDDEAQYGVSVSLPTEATMYADCLNAEGKCKSIIIENTASVTANLEIYRGDTNAPAIGWVSVSDDFLNDTLAVINVCAVDGSDYASISWTIDAFDVGP
jgi:hypothetical protein